MASAIHSSKKTMELMFLASVVVIVLAGLLIFQHGASRSNPVSVQVEGTKTVRLDTASDMMKALDATNDDGGDSDLRQLKTDTSGL